MAIYEIERDMWWLLHHRSNSDFAFSLLRNAAKSRNVCVRNPVKGLETSWQSTLVSPYMVNWKAHMRSVFYFIPRRHLMRCACMVYYHSIRFLALKLNQYFMYHSMGESTFNTTIAHLGSRVNHESQRWHEDYKMAYMHYKGLRRMRNQQWHVLREQQSIYDIQDSQICPIKDTFHDTGTVFAHKVTTVACETHAVSSKCTYHSTVLV